MVVNQHITKSRLDSGLTLSVENLKVNESITLIGDNLERVVVILGGTCTIQFEEENICWTGLGKRKNVFDGPATSIYLPSFLSSIIKAETDTVQLVVISAPAHSKREPYVIAPNDVFIEDRGQNEWSREVHNILSSSHPADCLLVGETFSTKGVWSGYPPHKHDTDNPPGESKHDEIYLIRVQPTDGFGIFINYKNENEREQAIVVRDMETITVEEGYHTIVAAAGHKFYYLWALAGDERELKCHVDPRYKWLSNN